MKTLDLTQEKIFLPCRNDFLFALYRSKCYNDVMATEAKKRAIERYNAKTYDRIYVRMKKADAERMKQHIGDRSVNGFINEAIAEKIERENK